jgi:uncharacterized paraquat-inducible protein A
MQQCAACGELFEREALVCPHCRTAVVRLDSFRHRRRARFALAVLLTTAVVLVWFLTAWLYQR